jgi:hypothetical protein
VRSPSQYEARNAIFFYQEPDSLYYRAETWAR